MKEPSLAVKVIALAISITCMLVGLVAFITEYSPARLGKLGWTGPFFGKDAKLIGVISMLIGLLPLLLFCKSPKQVATLGTLLFILLMAAIFGGIYLTR